MDVRMGPARVQVPRFMKTDSKRQKFVFKRTLAEARSLAFLALAPSALVLADARSLAFLALAPSALVLADA